MITRENHEGNHFNRPKSIDFIKNMEAANAGFAPEFNRFVFLPGMEFGAMKQWWGNGGSRPFPHEGADLCLFRTMSNLLYRIDDNIRVPVIYPGKISGIIPDFLGETVISGGIWGTVFPFRPPN